MKLTFSRTAEAMVAAGLLRATGAALGLIGLSISSAALAEDAEVRLREVRVSGAVSLIEEARAQSTLGGLTMDKPMAGSVLFREDIESVKSVSSLQDVMMRVPGVSKSRNMRIAMGGKNYTDNRVDGLCVVKTGVYGFLDQVDLANIERAEFINGPGSVLQSSYAIGGTINVITRDPPKTPEFTLSQEVGEANFLRTSASAGATMENGFGYLVDTTAMRNNGWRTRSGEDKDAFSVKIAGKPDDQSNLSLRLEYLTDDAYYPGQLTTAQWDANWQQAQPGVYGRGMTKYITPSLQYKRAVGDKGELILAVSDRFTDGVTWGNTFSYSTFSNTISVSKAEELSMQAIYRQDFDFAKSRLYVGIENIRSISDAKQYANAYAAARALQGAFTRGALSTTAGTSNTRENHMTPFVNYEFSPIDKLRLHLGVRADNIFYSVDDRTTANKDSSGSFKKNVPKLGATYDLNPNNLVWVSYAEGFLSPSTTSMLATRTPGTAGYIPASNLKPEESKTHEIGFRGYLPDSRLRYDVAVYHTSNKNMVVQRDCTAAEALALNGNAAISCKLNENVASMTAKGIETSLSLAASSWLDIGVSHTLAFTNYEQYKSTTFNYDGHSYYFTPKHHLNVRLAFKPMPGLRSELEGDYASKYWLDEANTSTYARPNLYHLRTSYSRPGSQWTAWAHILNLTDVKYADRMSLSSGVRLYNDGYSPRTIRLGASYKF